MFCPVVPLHYLLSCFFSFCQVFYVPSMTLHLNVIQLQNYIYWLDIFTYEHQRALEMATTRAQVASANAFLFDRKPAPTEVRRVPKISGGICSHAMPMATSCSIARVTLCLSDSDIAPMAAYGLLWRSSCGSILLSIPQREGECLSTSATTYVYVCLHIHSPFCR